MLLKNSKLDRGFTLIELLVVIAIIGLLSTIVITSVSTVRKRARDARRIADMRTISTALFSFYLDHDSKYPRVLAPTSDCTSQGLFPLCYRELVVSSGWDESDTDLCDNTSLGLCTPDGKFFLDALVPQYLSEVPVDPINNATYQYRYSFFNTGPWGCTGDNKKKMVFGIKNFEIPGAYRDPAFCGNPNGWAWVDGAYE